MEKINIFWFRRDLRLRDNIGLYNSLSSDKTLLLFIYDDSILRNLKKDDPRITFISSLINSINKKNLIKVKEDQFIEEFLPQVVGTNANCEVVDKNGNISGYITNKELQITLTKS